MSTSHVENGVMSSAYQPPNGSRLGGHTMEIGITDAAQHHVQRSVVRPKPISQRKLNFEHARPRWLREMAAEATGVFLYVYCGVAAQASFFTNGTEAQFGNLFTIGCAYALGIAFAIITSGATSGGHFNPAVTLCLAYWQGFPWKKVPYYIFAQIFGSFLAGLMIVGQYHQQLETLRIALVAAGRSPNSLGGPGSVLCSFPAPTQSYGYLFFIEFFVDSFLALIIWSVLDFSNPFVSPSVAPFIIGLAYAVMVWGFADITISTNLARDLGTRMVAAIFYGGDAFNRYSAIAILVNIPATFFGSAYYELVMRDSIRLVATGHGEHEEGEDGLMRHLTRTGTIDEIEQGASATKRKSHRKEEFV